MLVAFIPAPRKVGSKPYLVGITNFAVWNNSHASIPSAPLISPNVPRSHLQIGGGCGGGGG